MKNPFRNLFSRLATNNEVGNAAAPIASRSRRVKPPQKDKRPRFGMCYNLDNNPQVIREVGTLHRGGVFVAVIPLPFMSAKKRAQVREFTKTLWPAK